MNNDELIKYGLNHGDDKVRELAKQFVAYRNAALRVVDNMRPGSGERNRLHTFETSGERYPMYAYKR